MTRPLYEPSRAPVVEQTPPDVFGDGYLTYSIRTEFRDLCRLVGFENARQTVAEIINSECERRAS